MESAWRFNGHGTNKKVSPFQRHTKDGIAFSRPPKHDKKTH